MDTIPEAVFYGQMAAQLLSLGVSDEKNNKFSAFLQKNSKVYYVLNGTIASKLNITCEYKKMANIAKNNKMLKCMQLIEKYTV